MSGKDIDYDRMFHELPAGYMVLDMDMRFMDMNAAYLQSVARTREDLIGSPVFEAFPEHGERLETFRAAFARALAGEANSVVRQPFTLHRTDADGGGSSTVFWTCHHIPVYDKNGVQCGMLQRAENVTAEVDAERMRDVVLKELDHRVKNQLTVISAIARRSASAAENAETFLQTFEQRIGAMARTHQLLVDGNWDGLTLRNLVDSELRPYCETQDEKVRITGPKLMLNNAQAQSLGLAIHELTVNAAKYGALSDDDGQLAVNWEHRPGEDDVVFTWTESGLHGISQPVTSGFGSTILQRILPAELSATVTRTFHPDGMTCEIILPKTP